MWRREFLLAPLGSVPLAAAAGPFDAETLAWRAQREAALRKEDGWLSVAGLFWLEDGDNRIEPMPDARFALSNGSVRLVAAKNPVTVNGKPVREAVLTPNTDMVGLSGKRTLFVIARGGRYALRLRDPESRYRRGFKGLRWFPPKSSYRMEARWLAYPQPAERDVPSIGGITQKLIAPGEAEFTLSGKTVRLEPVSDGPGLMFVFKDLTAGKGTYPAGRFLDTAMPENGRLVLDFNRAYNPPCAFTPHATCPLPLRRNHVPVAIEAGELDYHFD